MPLPIFPNLAPVIPGLRLSQPGPSPISDTSACSGRGFGHKNALDGFVRWFPRCLYSRLAANAPILDAHHFPFQVAFAIAYLLETPARVPCEI